MQSFYRIGKLLYFIAANWRDIYGLAASAVELALAQRGMTQKKFAKRLRDATDYFVRTGDRQKLLDLLCEIEGKCEPREV